MKMKSVVELEGSKIRVHVAIRCAPLCNIGRLLLGVNTNVRFWPRLRQKTKLQKLVVITICILIGSRA